MSDLKLGLLPPTAKPRVSLAPFLTSAEPKVLSVDYLPNIGDWGMLGNDRYGDCFWAGMAHTFMANAAFTDAGEVRFSDEAVLAAYAGGTGFNPADPSTDQGTVLQDGLAWLTKNGIVDTAGQEHKILAFAHVNAADPNEVDRAHQLFGAVVNGFSIYQFAMSEFDAGRSWTLNNTGSRGPLLGGHCVPTMRTNVSRESRTCVTWGKAQPIGPGFWAHYFWESWAVITPEWVDLAGKSPSGLDLAGLMDEVHRLQGA